MNVAREIAKEALRNRYFSIGCWTLRAQLAGHFPGDYDHAASIEGYSNRYDLLPWQRMYLHQILKGL